MQAPASTLAALPSYKALAAKPAWAMVVAGLGDIAAYLALIGAVAAGLIPVVPAAIIAFFVIYVALSVAHETTHNTLGARNPALTHLNTAVGHLTSWLLLYDFPTFRLLHHEHHRFANQKGKDPDAWTQTVSAPACFVRALFIPLHYLSFYVRMVRKGRVQPKDFAWSLTRIALIVAVMIGLLVAFPLETFLLWILPASLTSAAGSVAHKLMHNPTEDPDLQKNARIILGQGLCAWPVRLFFWLHNNHYLHHTFPRLTALDHDRVYAPIADQIRAEGVTEIRVCLPRRPTDAP